MLPRIAWKTITIVLRSHKKLHQSASCMKKCTRNDTDSATISKNGKHFSAEQTLTALKTLLELHTRTPMNILRNPDFEKLCESLELYQHVKVLTNYDVDKRIQTKYLIEAKELLGTIVDHPMQQHLESAFGGPSFVYTKVRTRLGHIIDHVIVFDKQTMQPLQITGAQNRDVLYDTIATGKDRKQLIAVISFPRRYFCINKSTLKGIYELRLRAYEKMGIDVVAINHSLWNELLYQDKIQHNTK